MCQILQEENIRELAQRIIQDNISEKSVKAIMRVLAEMASNPVVGTSRLSRL